MEDIKKNFTNMKYNIKTFESCVMVVENVFFIIKMSNTK